jgi:hypothetical protein
MSGFGDRCFDRLKRREYKVALMRGANRISQSKDETGDCLQRDNCIVAKQKLSSTVEAQTHTAAGRVYGFDAAAS